MDTVLLVILMAVGITALSGIFTFIDNHIVFVFIAYFALCIWLHILIRKNESTYIYKDTTSHHWYKGMACRSCQYEWTSRRSTPPAKCAKCNSWHVIPVTHATTSLERVRRSTLTRNQIEELAEKDFNKANSFHITIMAAIGLVLIGRFLYKILNSSMWK